MNTAVSKETVTQLDEQLDKLLEIAKSTGTQQDAKEQVSALKDKKRNRNFKVLVIGEYATGKTALINSLIGEPILPEKAVTATAFTTEIKDGVEFIDSPGLNDPESYFSIIHDYIPDADAIIFCMCGHRVYTRKEKETLEKLCLMGYTSPIFAVTFFDGVRESIDDGEMSSDEIENGIEAYKSSVTEELSKHTDLSDEYHTSMLGGNGIFFLSSREARKAKRVSPWDEELYEKSGYKAFESYLGDYLVNFKGEKRLDMALGNLRLVMHSMLEEAYGMIDTWRNEYRCSINKEIVNTLRAFKAISSEFNMYMLDRYERFALKWLGSVRLPDVAEKIDQVRNKIVFSTTSHLLSAGIAVQVTHIVKGADKEIIEKKALDNTTDAYKRILSEPVEMDKIVEDVVAMLTDEFDKLKEQVKKSAQGTRSYRAGCLGERR